MSNINKKLRRQARYERNVKKEQTYKEEAWKNGKLIEPNHNNGPYPEEYCIELGSRLSGIMRSFDSEDNDNFLQFFRLYKGKVRDFILHYNPNAEKTKDYYYLRELIETYWDSPEDLNKVFYD